MTITFKGLEGNLEVYMDCLNAIIGDKRDSMIDLGCCYAPNTPMLGFEKRRYIDVVYRQLDHIGEQEHFEQADILETPVDVHYTVAFSLDSIEHLTISDGYKLLNIMNTISDRQIIFSPLTDLFGMAKKRNKNPEAHRSLWKPEELEQMFPNQYAYLIFPDYHKVWNGGAFFFYRCEGLQDDFERVLSELKTKSWYNGEN